MKLIFVLDLGISNISSLLSALNYLEVKYETLDKYPKGKKIHESNLILPGVGNFSAGVRSLKNTELSNFVFEAIQVNSNVLGICLGMQLLCSRSMESPTTVGLGLFDFELEKFDKKQGALNIQHVGQNSVSMCEQVNPLFKGIPDNFDFYFTHSYMVPFKKEDSGITAVTRNGNQPFASAIALSERFFGVQFHPEKSQSNGLKLLSNYSKF